MLTNELKYQNKNIDLHELPLNVYRDKLKCFQEKLKKHKESLIKIQKLEDEMAARIEEYKKPYKTIIQKNYQDNKLKELKNKIKVEEQKLAQRRQLLADIKENIKKREYKRLFSQVVDVCTDNLIKKQQELEIEKKELEICKQLYIARRTKVLYTLGYIYFNDNFKEIFKPLVDLKLIPNTTERTDAKIANTLGTISIFGIMMSRYLNLSLAYPLIYNGPRSMIKLSSREDYPLFLTSKSEKLKFFKAIELLVEDLLQIVLFCGIEFESEYESDRPIQLTEILLVISNYLLNP